MTTVAEFEGYSPGFHDVRVRDAGGQVCNVMASRYGAKGDGKTDDTAAIQAAIDDATVNGAGTVYFPDSPFLGVTVYIVTALHINNSGLALVGASASTVRIESRTGDVFTIADTTTVVSQLQVSNLFVAALPGGGHCFNVVGSLSQSVFYNTQFYQYNDSKAILYTSQASAGGGIFDTTMIFCYLHFSSTATMNAVYCYGLGNPASANRFSYCRVQGGGVSAFHLEAGPGAYVSSNSFDSLNFEVCDKGAIEIYSGLNTVLRNIGMFDNTTITHDLVYFGRSSTSCPQSRGTVIEGYCRTNGTLSGGAVDINFASGGNVGSNLASGISGSASAGVTLDVGQASGFVTLVGIDSSVTILHYVSTRTVQLDTTVGIKTPTATIGTVMMRDSGSGSLQLSFDNGSTWVTVTTS